MAMAHLAGSAGVIDEHFLMHYLWRLVSFSRPV